MVPRHTASERSRDLVLRFASDAGLCSLPGWGLGGSRLLGSERADSDIDIILKTESENLRDQVFDVLDHDSLLAPWEHSERARRFFELYKGRNHAVRRRNVFGGIWNGLRVDLFATFPGGLIPTLEQLSESIKSRREVGVSELSHARSGSRTRFMCPWLESQSQSVEPRHSHSILTAHYLMGRRHRHRSGCDIWLRTGGNNDSCVS